MKALKNILVATDFSEQSEQAVTEAIDLANKFKSKLYLLHVINSIQDCAVDYCLAAEDVLALKRRLEDEAGKKLDREIKKLAGRKDIKIIPEVRYGNPAEEILRDEDEKKIDLLVAAPHVHRGFFEKMGSHLTRKLVQSSPCDVLLVHPE